jgi:hypothetical protein
LNEKNEKFVPKKLNYVPRKSPDSIGRMAFGEYKFLRFEEVPNDYLDWVRDNFRNLKFYPNLEIYLKGDKNETAR